METFVEEANTSRAGMTLLITIPLVHMSPRNINDTEPVCSDAVCTVFKCHIRLVIVVSRILIISKLKVVIMITFGFIDRNEVFGIRCKPLFFSLRL